MDVGVLPKFHISMFWSVKVFTYVDMLAMQRYDTQSRFVNEQLITGRLHRLPNINNTLLQDVRYSRADNIYTPSKSEPPF